MLCSKKCPRDTKCKPLSNVVSTNKTSFVCVGLHCEEKEISQDKFRHCFKSAAGTDSVFDYDEYDILSVMTVFSEALLIDNLKNQP